MTIPPPTGGARGGRLLQEGFFAKQSGRSTSGLATEGTQESRARGGHHRLFMLVFLRRARAYNNVEMLFVTFVHITYYIKLFRSVIFMNLNFYIIYIIYNIYNINLNPHFSKCYMLHVTNVTARLSLRKQRYRYLCKQNIKNGKRMLNGRFFSVLALRARARGRVRPVFRTPEAVSDPYPWLRCARRSTARSLPPFRAKKQHALGHVYHDNRCHTVAK